MLDRFTQTPIVAAFSAVLAFSTSWAGVHVLKRWLEARQVLDVPNERSSHTAPVPRGGGIPIVVLILVAMGILASVADFRGLWAIGAASMIIAMVSFRDDLRSVPTGVRFSVQAVAAIVVIAAAGAWSQISGGSCVLELPAPLAMVVTFLWLVGLTNAYNFMDGIDLMAAGQAVAGGIGWIVLGHLTQTPVLTILGAVIAASAAGFAVHNWPPASIFMGDVGSAFLGFSFAAISIVAFSHDAALATCGALLVWPFVFDTAATFVRRMARGERVFSAHRSHLYQRLVIAGHPHLRVSLIYVTADLVGLACAILIVKRQPHAFEVTALAIGACATLLWILVLISEKKARLAAG